MCTSIRVDVVQAFSTALTNTLCDVISMPVRAMLAAIDSQDNSNLV